MANLEKKVHFFVTMKLVQLSPGICLKIGEIDNGEIVVVDASGKIIKKIPSTNKPIATANQLQYLRTCMCEVHPNTEYSMLDVADAWKKGLRADLKGKLFVKHHKNQYTLPCEIATK